jgi:hypothetical protein
MQRFHGLAAQWLTDKSFPPCLRRSGFAQAGLKLRHVTACSDLQPKWSLVNCDTVSKGGKRGNYFLKNYSDLDKKKRNVYFLIENIFILLLTYYGCWTF